MLKIMNKIFNPTRFGYLLNRQILINFRGLAIAAGCFIGIFVFLNAIILYNNPLSLNSQTFFAQLLPVVMLGGIIFTSNIFVELNKPQQSFMFLTLPATITEKLAVAWFTSSVMYLAAAIVSIFIVNVILIIIGALFFGHSVQLFNLFNTKLLHMYAIYMVIQPMFLLGAISFRKNNFFKTLGTLILAGFVLALYVGLLMKIVFNGLDTTQLNVGPNNLSLDAVALFSDYMPTIAKVLFWGFTAPFFLVVSYFSLKERQV
jgi:hypothetical protein